MNGATNTASSRDSAIIPATNWLNWWLIPYGSPSLSRWLGGRAPGAQVQVPRGACPGVIGLGHERDPPPVEEGDLLRAVLEQDAPVGRLEDVVVADVGLVMTGARSL